MEKETRRDEFKSGQRRRITGRPEDESGVCEEASDSTASERGVLPAYRLCWWKWGELVEWHPQ